MSERVGYIGRVRKLARVASLTFVKQREAMGWPLLTDEAERVKWVKAAEGA